MKKSELKSLLKESVREVFQEEIKEILLESIKSSGKEVIKESYTPNKPLPSTVKFTSDMAKSMMVGTQSKPKGSFSPQGVMPGADLPSGDVDMGDIMGIMTGLIK